MSKICLPGHTSSNLYSPFLLTGSYHRFDCHSSSSTLQGSIPYLVLLTVVDSPTCANGCPKNGPAIYDKDSYNQHGFHRDTRLDRDGLLWDPNDFHEDDYEHEDDDEGLEYVYDADGYNGYGFDAEGYDRAGFDTYGVNRDRIDEIRDDDTSLW